MKYMKYFESEYINHWDVDDYSKISENEYMDICTNPLPFTMEEIRLIISMVEDYNGSFNFDYDKGDDHDEYGNPYWIDSIEFFNHKEDHYTINKMQDEWYLITDDMDIYYKCDQWDGMTSCLKKIFNI